MKMLMRAWMLLPLLLLGALVLTGCVQSGAPAQNSSAPMVGSDRDAHGCIGSAGYTWCESKSKCIRTWEESCPAKSTGIVVNDTLNSTNQSAYCSKGDWTSGLSCINDCPSGTTCFASNCTCIPNPPANQTNQSYTNQTNPPAASCAKGNWTSGLSCINDCPSGTTCTSACTCILPIINQTNETVPPQASPCTPYAVQCSGRTTQICTNGKWLDSSVCDFGCSGGQCLSQVIISNFHSMIVGVPTSVVVSMKGAVPAYYTGSLAGSPSANESGSQAVFTITCQQAGTATFSVSAYSSSGKLLGTTSSQANCMKR